MTPTPEPRELPKNEQNWAICTKESWMLIIFSLKLISSILRELLGS